MAGLERSCAARSQRGSISILASGVIVLLVVLTFLVAVPLTQGLSQRRAASTAADAAALAAAQEWSDRFEQTHANLEYADDATFWAFPGLRADRLAVGRLRQEAATFAAANDATLESFSVHPSRLEITVRVRMTGEAIDGTGIHATHAATSEVRLRGGLCASNGRLGLPRRPCLVEPPRTIPADRPDWRPYRADVLLVR